jgi:hypothetical protein
MCAKGIKENRDTNQLRSLKRRIEVFVDYFQAVRAQKMLKRATSVKKMEQYAPGRWEWQAKRTWKG